MNFPICVLQAMAFLDLLAVGLIVPLVSGHVRKMGASYIYIGLLGSIYAGFQLGSGPVIGSLSDIKGRKQILIFTLLICAAAYTLLGFTDSVLLILVIRAVQGLFKQTQMLTRALVPDFEKSTKEQSSIYGRMAAISGIGITVGPVIGGHVLEDYPDTGFKMISVTVGICFLANAGLMYFLPKAKGQTKKKPKIKKSKDSLVHSLYNNFKQSLIELYKVEWSNYWDIFMFKALIGFAMGVYYTNYSTYLKAQYTLSPKYIGYVISFQGVIGSISSFFIGCIDSYYTHDTDFSIRTFHVFVLLTTALLGLIFSFNVYMYVIWLIPLAIGNAVGRLVTLEMILIRSCGEHRGTLIGASNSVRSLSGVVAPMVAGLIGQYFGVTYVIYASFFSTSLGLLLSYNCQSKRLKAD